MGRTLLVALCALTLGACQEPLVIIGDLPGFMRIVAGVADSVGTREDSAALATKLTQPSGIAVATTGLVYFADQSSRIFSLTSSGKLTVIAKSLFCFEKTCLGRPQGIALSTDQRILYIADDMSDKIWKLTLANNDLVTIAGTGVNGISPDGTAALQASLASPNGIAVLPDGRVAFAERNSNRIRVIGSDGNLGTLAGNGTQGNATDGATASSAPLNVPTGLALGGNVLYVSETGSNTVRAIDLSSNTIRLVAGNGSSGFSGDEGPAVNAALNTPTFMAVSDNTLYIADQQNDRIRAVNLQNGVIATFAGTGARVFNGNGRAAAETSIYYPNGLAISSFGYLYISDLGHNIVWRTPVRANLQQ